MVSYSEGKISSVDRLTRITLQIIHEKWQRRKAGNSGFLVTLEALKALSGARPLQFLEIISPFYRRPSCSKLSCNEPTFYVALSLKCNYREKVCVQGSRTSSHCCSGRCGYVKNSVSIGKEKQFRCGLLMHCLSVALTRAVPLPRPSPPSSQVPVSAV